MFKRKLKTIFLAVLFCLGAGNLFAVEEYVSKVYKEIDVIFVKQADKELANILRENVEDKYYYLMENYTKKKVRRLIIDNEYEFAMTAIYIIIDNNIDGDFEDEDAVDLYAAIAEAYEIQQQYEKEQEEKAIAEAAKKEAEKEKLIAATQKDYNVVTTAEGKQVYVSSKDERTEKYRWNANFGMIDFGVLTAASAAKPLMSEGIALDVTYEYSIPKSVVVGGDLFFDFKFMAFNGGPMEFNFEAAPKVAFPFAPKFFIRLGFSDLNVLKSTQNHLFSGIQARHRILEDHLHVRSQITLVFFRQLSGYVASVEDDLAVGRVVQPDDGAPCGGFTGSGFADKAVGLSLVDVEADAVHGLCCETAADPEVLLQILDMKQRCSVLTHTAQPPSSSFLS